MKRTASIVFAVLACLMMVSCATGAGAVVDANHEHNFTKDAWQRVDGKDVYLGKQCSCGEIQAADVQIGTRGPAGGYIFAINSEEGDWKYLEAAPSLLYQSGKDVTVYQDVPSGATIAKAIFGYYDVDGKHQKVGTVATLGKGKENTEAIYATVCKNGKASADANGVPYAAYYAKNLSIKVNGVTFDDWYIPSSSEMKQYYLNISCEIDDSVIPAAREQTVSYMSSTEKAGNEAYMFSSWAVKYDKTASATAQKDRNIPLPVLVIRSI